MSIKMMSVVWESNIPSSEKFVLLALADHARDDGSRVFPSISTIALKTGFSDRTVQRCLRKLVAMEIISVVKKSSRYGTTEYFIRGDNLTPLKPTGGVKYDGQGCHDVTPGVTNTTSRGDTVSPNTYMNRQLNHQKHKAETSFFYGNCKNEQITSDTPLPKALQSEWDQLLDIYPKPQGIIKGKDPAIRLFIRSPERSRILRAAREYSCSDVAKAGFVMNLDKFLSGRYREYDADEIPLGRGSPIIAGDRTWRNERLRDEETFREQQRKAESGEIIPQSRARPGFIDEA